MKRAFIGVALAACILMVSSLAGAQATPVTTVPPVYPLKARAAGIDGTVVLKGTVSKEGKMQDLHVLSGPPELYDAAIGAVMKWTYKPYKHFGHPVEVDTTVRVNFSLGKTAEDRSAAQAKAKTELAKSADQPDPQGNSDPQAAKR